MHLHLPMHLVSYYFFLSSFSTGIVSETTHCHSRAYRTITKRIDERHHVSLDRVFSCAERPNSAQDRAQVWQQTVGPWLRAWS